MFQPIVIPITIPGVVLLTAVVLWFMPLLTRHDLYFAVTVAPWFPNSAKGKFILRRYRSELILVSMLAVAAVAVTAFWRAAELIPLVLLMQLAGSFVVFYRARHLVLPQAVPPTTIREAEIRGRDRRIPGGWMVTSGPFVLLVACATYLWSHWDDIPTRFIVHWGADGQPDRWATRSFASVYTPLLGTAAILTALTLILYGMSHWARSIHVGGLRGARELKFRRTVAIILLAAEYLITLQSCWVALSSVFFHLRPGLPGGAIIALIPLFLVLIVVAVLVPIGQGGSRTLAPNEMPSGFLAAPVGDRTRDCYWTLGFFYFNRADPAVIVEKRFGIGYTLNFGRPMSWIITMLVVLVPLVVAILRV